MKRTPSDARLLEALASHEAPLFEVLELFDYFDEVQFWMKDRDGRFNWVNRYFLFNYGLEEREQAIGRTDLDLCSAALANQFRLDDEKVLQGTHIVSRIEMVGRFDHSSVWCLTTKLPLRDGQGRIIGTTGITRPYRRQPAESGADAPLSGAIEYIGRHLTERITNVELARAAGVSLRVFHRKFRELYHSSPQDYVRKLRVRTSCHALVFTDKTIAEIAGEFGYSDQSHFTHEFRQIIGETPRGYRSRHKR